ncbi:22511_t:CDS:2, partial [Cetraspora pellucida]
MFPQRRRSGRWTEQEKQLLETLVQTYGYNWRLIAILMQQTRDQRQIREQRRITPSESQRIQDLFVQYGRQWKLIASFFPGFSPIMVRNHWNNLQRKRMNQLRSQNQQPDFAPFGSYQQLDHQPALAPPSDSSREKMSIP